MVGSGLETLTVVAEPTATGSTTATEATAEWPVSAERTPQWRRLAVDVAVLFVVTRVVLTLVGLMARQALPGPVIRPRPLGITERLSDFSFLDVWGEWDSSWYVHIAEYGYKDFPVDGPFANYGFFPLYPLLSRWVGWVVGGSSFVGGLVVSNVALIVACVFLYRLVLLDDDEATARRAVKYLFVAPVAFLFSAMLTEGLYLALVIMCFYFARTKRWWVVGGLGFLVALSRQPGVLVAIPLAWIYLEQVRATRGSIWRLRPDVLALGFIPAGLGVFMWFCWRLTGDPLAYADIGVTAWGNELRNPFSYLWQSYSSPAMHISVPAWYMTGALVLAVALLRRLSVPYALFVLISLFVPLTYGGPAAGTLRYTAVIFPLYIGLARVTRDRAAIDQAIVVGFALLQAFFITLWVNNSPVVI